MDLRTGNELFKLPELTRERRHRETYDIEVIPLDLLEYHFQWYLEQEKAR